MRSKWRVDSNGKALFVCALCLLYKTKWGKSNRKGIDRVIKAVEEHGKFKFRRHKKKLFHCSNADQILWSINFTSQMFDAEDARRKEAAQALQKGTKEDEEQSDEKS